MINNSISGDNKSEIKVSVHVLTYNHKDYVNQALEGIVKQKVSFNYEVIIGDDFSNDGTREVLLSYKAKYPQLIKLLLHPKNLGPKGLEGKNNFLSIYNKCSSKYIAMCEGDDYWTDENKLQKQIDFLEANPDYAICFHAVNVLRNGEESFELNQPGNEETYSILDLAKSNIIHTPSVIFRNGLFEKFPDWFNQSPAGDYILHMLNAKKGLIKYFPESMAVYRVHDQSNWAKHGVEVLFPKWLWLLDKLIKEDFDADVIKILSEQKQNLFNEYLELLLNNKRNQPLKNDNSKFYKLNELPDVNLIIDMLIEKIDAMENEIIQTKKRKSMRLATKLSSFKNKSAKFLSGKPN